MTLYSSEPSRASRSSSVAGCNECFVVVVLQEYDDLITAWEGKCELAPD